jgi:hypothetical protein
VRISGTPTSYESSPGTLRQFCGICGTGLFYRSESIFPGKVDIQGAAFDDPDAFAPAAHIQVADAPMWRSGMPELPHFGRYPGTD